MDNYMEYKGYIAKIEYSDEDGCFFGSVGIKKALILFEGDTVAELRKDFEEAIDQYLDSCKRDGVEPEKQCKGSLNVRLGIDLHAKAKIKSEEENISINELIKRAVEQYVGANKVS